MSDAVLANFNKTKQKRKKMSRDEIILQVICVHVVAILSIAIIVPVMYVVSMSLTSEAEILRNSGRFVLFPQQITFTAYTWLLDGGWVFRSMFISVLRAFVGTVTMLFFTSMAAYTLTRKGMPGRNIFIMLVLITILFGAGLIPNFLLITSLGLRNSFWVFIIPGLIDSWGLLIIKQNMEQLPESLDEAARLDGANDLQIYFRVVLPLSVPVLAVVALFSAVNHWNAWFDALIYIENSDLWPFQLVLRNVLTGIIAMRNVELGMPTHAMALAAQVNNEALKMAAVVVGTIPILCVYPFMQKFFTKGILTGSVKG